MTRFTIELPNGLHKALKSFSVVNGQTMKDIAIFALESYVQSRIGNKLNNDTQITEEQADELLQPVLMQYANQIQDGNFSGEDWQDVKGEIEKDLK